MRKLFFLLFAMVPIVLSAKDTRKVTIEYLFPPFREIFYVLKSDSSVKHGPYRLVLNGRILNQGFYKMGQRDSLWTEYNSKGKLKFRGFYTENKQVGIWEYYDENGAPEQKIDFTNNRLLLYRSRLIGQTFRVISHSDSTFSYLDRPPLYLGGMSKIKEFIDNEIQPPLHKAKEPAMGKVFIEFTIDSTGKTSHHRVLKGLGTACNSEALRVIKSLPDCWFPGMLNGRSVTVNYVIPILFNKEMYEKTPSSFLPELNYNIPLK